MPNHTGTDSDKEEHRWQPIHAADVKVKAWVGPLLHTCTGPALDANQQACICELALVSFVSVTLASPKHPTDHCQLQSSGGGAKKLYCILLTETTQLSSPPKHRTA